MLMGSQLESSSRMSHGIEDEDIELDYLEMRFQFRSTIKVKEITYHSILVRKFQHLFSVLLLERIDGMIITFVVVMSMFPSMVVNENSKEDHLMD
jgi:hypothetical protein